MQKEGIIYTHTNIFKLVHASNPCRMGTSKNPIFLRATPCPRGFAPNCPVHKFRCVFLQNRALGPGGGGGICLEGNCSATRYSVAAPPPGARQGFGGPMRPRHTPRGGRERCDRGLWGGVAATPLLHTQNCGMSRNRGVATPWSPTGGGCSVCPTKAICDFWRFLLLPQFSSEIPVFIVRKRVVPEPAFRWTPYRTVSWRNAVPPAAVRHIYIYIII